MNPFPINIEDVTSNNTDYRRVLHTGHYMQLVVMNLKPNEEIGSEIHGLDQFIRIETGRAHVIVNNGERSFDLPAGWAIIIPAGTYHNVINTGKEDLKLYTLYAPPAHLKDTLQPTKADEKEDHFNGITSE